MLGFVWVLREYERGIVFRLGRLVDPRGPGIVFLIPVVDRLVKVDLRTVTLNVPAQEVITKDNVPAKVNAVAYFRIVDPNAAITQVENFMVATSQIAQTTLRAAREGDQRRGRVPGGRTVERRGDRDRGPPDRPAAQISADPARDRHHQLL